MVNGADKTIDILDVSDPTNPNFIRANRDIDEFGDGINSIANRGRYRCCCDIEGEAADDLGTIVFF